MRKSVTAIKIDTMDVEVAPDMRLSLLARSRVVLLPVTLVFMVLFASSVYLQMTVGASSLYKSEQNAFATRQIKPSRGLFYDRNGSRLVINENVFELTINSQDYSADLYTTFVADVRKQLGRELAMLDSLPADSKGELVLIKSLTLDDSNKLQVLANKYKFALKSSTQRQYLYGAALAQVLGYTGIPNKAQLQSGYAIDDIVGQYGLEKVLEPDLRGVGGRDVSASGQVSSLAPVAGNNVFLTIESDWQRSLYNMLGKQIQAVGGQSGAVAIVDISNGDIWAYVSWPSFDANQLSRGITGSEYSALLAQPGNPLVDKVIASQTSPGSTFKLISAYAALQNGAIDENTHYYSNRCISLGDGYPFCEFGKFFIGDLDIKRALARSSNIFFCNSILKLSHEQGYDKFMSSAKQLNIGNRTGIILENELSGILASPEVKLKLSGDKWFDGDICNAVIGQGLTSVTTLQMAMVAATISNGGNYYQPNLIAQVQDQQGNIIKANYNKLDHQIPLSPKTQELILGGMNDVVNSAEGTAYYYLHAAPGNFKAKTGSVESFQTVNGVSVSKEDGWIVGTFDNQGKRFAFAADIRYGGGGWNVSQLMQYFSYCITTNYAQDGCFN